MDGNKKEKEALWHGFQCESDAGCYPGRSELAKLAAKHGVHHRMIAAWKRQTIEGMSAMFSGAGDTTRTASDAEVDKLPIEIERLLVDRIVSRGLQSMNVAQRRAWIDSVQHACWRISRFQRKRSPMSTGDAA